MTRAPAAEGENNDTIFMPRAVHVSLKKGMVEGSIDSIPFHRHQEFFHLLCCRAKSYDVFRKEGGREGGRGAFHPTTTVAVAAAAAAATAAAAAALLSIAMRGVPKGIEEKFVGCGCCQLRGASLKGGRAV